MFDRYFGNPDIGRYQVGPRYVCGRDGDFEAVDVPERLEDAEFWGVYIQEPDELWCWLKDFPTEQEALEFVREALALRRKDEFFVGMGIVSQPENSGVFV